MKTFCFKLYQSKKNRRLRRQINIAGIVYNHCIALYRRYYKLYHKSLRKYQLQKHLVKLKGQKKYSYWNEIPSHAIQDITDRIYRAYAMFFSNQKRKVKTSPPKFKKVRKYKSFSYNMPGKNIISGNVIKLAGGYYKFFKSREIQGQIKVVTVKRDAVGDMYVYLVCDVQQEPVEARTGKSVGFDFGLKTFLTASDGQDINSPYFFMENIKIIRKKSRNLSSKKEGSNNRERARKDLARAYRKLCNQRHDFHFKTARKLCEQYACICLETLNIRGMARIWGRKIHSLGFYSFVKILEYEASNFGTRVIFVPQHFPSSQLCHVCGYKNADVKNLKIREWECPNCHTHHDRDRNAAINILMAVACLRRAMRPAISGDTVRPEQSGGVVDARIPRLC
ncbi:MAG: transposase [Synergistaceae bacterium]|nr:transposase [Synergistaceae bacterium]